MIKIALLRVWVVVALLGWGAVTARPVAAQKPAREPQIFFSAFYRGQWDIFGVSPDGTSLWQITNDIFEDSDPAISPDGDRLAYASRRMGNWDVYLLDLASGNETRLTTHPHFDGAPAWSPDGKQIAFESFRSGDLDVWLMAADGSTPPQNLTADSPAQDYAPAWNDTGDTLFFTSARAGDDDIWSLGLPSGELTQLTFAETSDSRPAWDAIGQRLGFTVNSLGERDIWFRKNDDESLPLTWLGSADEAVFNPDGAGLAAVLSGANADRIIRLDENDPAPHYLTPPLILQGGISWGTAVVAGQPIETFLPQMWASGLYTETVQPSKSSHGEPFDLVRLNDLNTGVPWLADTVDDSFRAMRYRLRDEVGYDFLGTLSEALRPLDFSSDASQYTSWHKSGRAFDTRFDLPGGRLQIVKETIGGNVYWRVMLRCDDQNGTCGKPATARPWDYSGRARTILAPEQGGVEKPPLYGYYVDFTQWAREYGWQRISSHDDENFSWTWHFKAFEYWHFQKPLFTGTASNWYAAVKQVYPPDETASYFTWQKMRSAGEDADVIMLKGAPAPPAARRWWQQLTNK